MGLFFSCCRRQKDHKEREPLLPKHRVDAAADEYLPSKTQLNRLVDVVAALKTGKLPTQEQLNHIIRSLLHSTAPGSSYGTLSGPGRQVLSDFRELLDVLLLVGLEKNDDNKLQELAYQISKIPAVPVHADVIVNAGESSTLDVQDVVGEIPTKDEATSDITEFVLAVRQISIILLTSSTFRIILSDLFKTAREIVADTAADVGRVAATVEATADKVEKVLRSEDATFEDTQIDANHALNELTTEVPPVSFETLTRWQLINTAESPERCKDAAIGRLQQAISQAHSNPEYQRALRTILYLLNDYADRLSNISAALADAKAPTITPILWADNHLTEAMSHFSTLISRIASGRSIDPWVGYLRTVVCDVGKLPTENDELHELRNFFIELGSWFGLALDNPQYATSSIGRDNAEAVYDHGRCLLNDTPQSNKPWAQHIRDLMSETDQLLKAVSNDRTTSRLVDAVSTLSASLSNYARSLVHRVPGQLEQSKFRIWEVVQRDVLQWLLPRVLRAIHVIPVPRVEYRSSSLDAAIDTIYLTPASAHLSLIPDNIHVQYWSEIHLNLSEVHPEAEAEPIVPAVEYNGMQTHTKLRVSVKGIRFSARNIAYYACYRVFGSNKWLAWFGYEDEGLVSVDVGSRGVQDEGLSVDFEVQFLPERNEDDQPAREEPLFLVRDVQVDLPGLRFTLDRSKHWALNKMFLQPLATPAGRILAAWVLRNQIQTLLEFLATFSGRVARNAQQFARDSQRDVETGDYASAIWEGLIGLSETQAGQGDDEVEVNEEAPLTGNHTTTTAMGIVRTSVTFPSETVDGTSPARPIEESVLAIGVGEQILPGKGGPHDTHGADEYGPRELGREALDEIQSRVDEVVRVEETVVGRASKLTREAQDAAEREAGREQEEAVEGGWKSDAFDF
ncbi:hypothetical protein BDY19DRAFT_891712 [Irpex rosettiformis]|uniref:Uncharacterized protein n=1 Tax=Irpex rosettiformis TaxID=378272 RepID=A0ACB8U174_9APHY|nr:hypothetical protein BDY19DRAFT_891712 [Irpex rosettiformis]